MKGRLVGGGTSWQKGEVGVTVFPCSWATRLLKVVPDTRGMRSGRVREDLQIFLEQGRSNTTEGARVCHHVHAWMYQLTTTTD